MGSIAARLLHCFRWLNREEERKMRMAISVYSYLKRMAAIQCLQYGKEKISVTEAQALMNMIIRHVHDPLSWPFDIEERVKEMKLGQW